MTIFIWAQTIFWGVIALVFAAIAVEDRDVRSYWRIVLFCAVPSIWGAWLLIGRL